MAREYNYIYSKLVNSHDDILGIISYSVYKRQKIQHIERFKSQHDRDPKEDELASFSEMSTSDSQLSFYRSEAAAMTEKFLADVLEEDLEEREKFFSKRVHDEIAKVRPNHLLDILKGALGSVLFVVISGILYFAVWSISASPKVLIEQMFGVKIVSLESVSSRTAPLEPLEARSVSSVEERSN